MTDQLKNTPMPPKPQDLVRVSDRMTFLYAEHVTVGRSENAVTLKSDDGTVRVPSAALSVLMLGPGTRVTHRAMEELGDDGTTVVWVGERGVRFYAYGKGLTRNATYAIKQAKLVSNTRSRLRVAKAMYNLRYPGEDVRHCRMSDLRLREGNRMKQLYKQMSRQYGVPWNGRVYDEEDYEDADPINQALTTAYQCLYGLAHAVIVSLGCVPSLGFVHNGNARAFVFDVADLYKAEVAIPVAFQTVASGTSERMDRVTRGAMRDRFGDLDLVSRMVHDIEDLLEITAEERKANEGDDVSLWDDREGSVDAYTNYGDDDLDDDRDDASES